MMICYNLKIQVFANEVQMGDFMKRLVSTRNIDNTFKYSEAILKGLADDHGLFVPESFDSINFKDNKFLEMDYKGYAFEILKSFLEDFDETELKRIINLAYANNFDDDQIVPVKKVGEGFIVELFHGPTLAFKDMALSILPHLLATSKKKLNKTERTVILTATSGDTGKAALEGFKDTDLLDIFVFYPDNGVSPIQELQMKTQEGNNVHVYGIQGNFDDAQSHVKSLLNDSDFNQTLRGHNCHFSSANSINIGRLLPQIVYYVSSYFELVKTKEIRLGDEVNVVVPTGNFGNILAGKYAKLMGLPIKNLICASNENNILTDFINTGVYNKNRDFIKTMSPSMDILISSNLERLLFYLSNGNDAVVSDYMNQLKSNDIYKIDADMHNRLKDFKGYYTNEAETLSMIKTCFNKYNYLLDPHTSVAYHCYQQYLCETQDDTKTLILSTASPYKFPNTMAQALDLEVRDDVFDLLEDISAYTATDIPENINNLSKKSKVHNEVLELNQMKNIILQDLNIF